MKKILGLILAVICLTGTVAQADYHKDFRRKNDATRFRVPLMDESTHKFKTGDAANITLKCGCAAENSGITLGNCNAGTTIAEIATNSGIYEITVNAADTNGDHCIISVVSATANVESTAVELTTRLELNTLQILADTGDAVYARSYAGNGNGAVIQGNGSGHGIDVEGTNGIYAVSTATGGAGIQASATSGNGTGIKANGFGTGAGLSSTGGATGDGIKAIGGATGGHGIQGVGTAGTGGYAGIYANGGSYGLWTKATGNGSGNGSGIYSVGVGNGSGASFAGVGTEPGISAVGGVTGDGASFVAGATGTNSTAGLRIYSGSNNGYGFYSTGVRGNYLSAAYSTYPGLDINSTASGVGLKISGGSTAGDGINVSTTLGDALSLNAAGASKRGLYVASTSSLGAVLSGASTGLYIVGGGTADGLKIQGGTTGNGLNVLGGATSGNGIQVTTTNDDAVKLTPAGTGKSGIVSTGTWGFDGVIRWLHGSK